MQRPVSAPRSARFAAFPLGLAIAFLGAPAQAADDWCDQLFKDVSAQSAGVVLARYEASAGRAAALRVLEVLAGSTPADSLSPRHLGRRPARDGDVFLVSLRRGRSALTSIATLGACSAITVLKIRDGALTPRERLDYDGVRARLDLDALRTELRSVIDREAPPPLDGSLRPIRPALTAVSSTTNSPAPAAPEPTPANRSTNGAAGTTADAAHSPQRH